MTDIAIRVENLSKLYHIGRAQRRHDTLRDSIADFGARLADLLPRRSNPKSTTQNPKSDTIWALKDVSFEVQRGEVVGIIGRNGAGKSTLLKILSQITEPTGGRAEVYGRIGSLLEVGTGFHPELTGRENIYLNGAILGMRKAEIERRFDEIVAFAEIEKFLDTPVKRYSSGMYVRLAFAVAAHLEPEILLVDEVLAVGDAAFQKKCLGKMGDVAKEGRTVLFVSHNMAAVAHLCSKTIVLNDGEVIEESDTETAIVRYLQLITSDQIDGLNTVERIGRGPIRFKSFHIEDDEGRILTHIVSGQNINFIITYASSVSCLSKSIEVAIAIRTSDGVSLLNLSTYYFDSIPFQELPMNGQFECRLKKFPMRSGIYWVDLYCAVEERVSDHLRYAARFQVSDGDYFGSGRMTKHQTGFVLIDHSWRIRSGRVFKLR